MRTTFDNFGVDLSKFLTFLKATPLIYSYIENCISNDLPDEFNADAEVDTVQQGHHIVFGPFGGSDNEEVAEIFLILQSMHEKGISGTARLFFSYASGSNKYQDMLKGFLDKVAYILINHIDSYLVRIGFEMGLDEQPSQVVSVNNSPNFQINTAYGQSTLTATQNNNSAIDELEPLLARLARYSKRLNMEDQELVEDSVETLREEVASGNPKKKVIRPVLAALKGVNESTQFAAAVTQIAAFFSALL
jgi:hypothetical protein